jgi:hypothetical protein
MKALLAWLGALLVAVSIGTTLTVVVFLGMLWWRGALDDQRVLAMLAALQGIEPPPPPGPSPLDTGPEQPSLEQLVQARLQANLDLDLRENAIDKSLADLRVLQAQLQTESRRLDDWKRSFDKRLADLQSAAANAALLELQRTFEAVAPKQAKEQILRMLKEPATPQNDPMRDIVTILRAMPLDKRKKILAEFKTDEEIEKLAEILRQLRLGNPDADLLRDTRSQLQQQLAPSR